MVRRPKLLTVFAATLFAVLAALPGLSRAQTSVEGVMIGDQGYYWNTPAEVWAFPSRLGNVDNRVMLQYGGPTMAVYNLDSVQRAPGGGFVLELTDGLNVGLWLAAHNSPFAGFVGRGVAATGWDHAATTSVDDLAGIDTYDPSLAAGRKGDLFASYWLPDLGLETGLHLWWGSAHSSLKGDDSLGPIDIDSDSDPATPAGEPVGREDQLEVAKSMYSVSEFGIGLGVGYRAIKGFAADFGLDVTSYNLTWEPNAIEKYVDAGGYGIALNGRAHYALSDSWTVGGFGRFSRVGMNLTPLLQRDGGDLPDIWLPANDDEAGTLPDPGTTLPSADPNLTGLNEDAPVNDIAYDETTTSFQVAGLVSFRPVSRATLYAALGMRRTSWTDRVSVDPDWYDEHTTTAFSIPFVHVGFEGKVSNYLDLMLGATKQWQTITTTHKAEDRRIPANGNAQGAPGVPPAPPPPGNEYNTNDSRSLIEESQSFDDPTSSTLSLMLGTRVSYGPVQLVSMLDPTVLLSGTYLLSGNANNPWFWVSLVYDWDYDTDTDTDSGNGTIRAATERPAATPVVPAAPAPSPPPTPSYEEFDS